MSNTSIQNVKNQLYSKCLESIILKNALSQWLADPCFPVHIENLTWKYQSPAQHPDAPTIPSNICHFWHPTFWPLHPDMLCRPVEKLCPISALPPLPIIKQMYIYKWQCFYCVCSFQSIYIQTSSNKSDPWFPKLLWG